MNNNRYILLKWFKKEIYIYILMIEYVKFKQLQKCYE